MNSAVPEGWENRQFGQFCREKSVKFDGKSELPVLSVTKYDGFVSSLDYFNKQVFSRDLSSYKVVRKGQFAYATIHLDEGSLGLLSDYDGGLISPMYTVFETTQECDSKFLFFLMKSDLYMTKYPALGQGSINRRMSISFRSLSELNIATPPLPEQKKIASILTSVDEVIENTQKQIDKLQDLKKATMNELLTKGIGHTEFKDSELGRIPKSWEIKTIRELIDKVVDNRGKTPPLSESGIELIEIASISKDNRFLNYRLSKKRVTEDTYHSWFRNGHPKVGDVLVPTVGLIGQCSIVREERGCIAQNLIGLRSSERLLGEFLYWVINSHYVLAEIQRVLMGAVQPSLKVPHLLDVSIPLPPISEQRNIINILHSIEDNVIDAQERVMKTKDLKKSLMQDLLTGKVRVTVN